MRIVGVDPGCYGALALLVGDSLRDIVDMPIVKVRRGKTDKAEVNGYELGDVLRRLAPDVLVIEQVGGMTGQGASMAFNFGRAAGAPEYAAKTLGVRVEPVAPITWKRALRVNPGKDGSRHMAMKLWPGSAAQFARKKDDGRAEAALIARWFRQQNRGGDGVFA